MSFSKAMSEIFLSGADHDIFVGEMSSRRAQLFVAVTEAASSIYKVEGVIIERVENAYFLHPEPFCLLVERVFEWPIDLLHSWSYYATGLYENIKGESQFWEWRGGSGERGQQNLTITIKPVKWPKESGWS